MKLKIIGLLLLSLFSFSCWATSQIPDSITINDVRYRLNTNPLDKYLADMNWEPPEEASISSANWRGYLAGWKVEAGQLLLEDIVIRVRSKENDGKTKRVSIFDTLFPAGQEVLATWYSGALIIPYGEMTSYVHMGYGSTYENYIVLRVSEGVVIEHLDLSEAEFEAYKHRKFQAFIETEKFQEELEKLMNDEYQWTEEQALGFMQSYYAEYYLSLE